jgi:hypothetical protein
MFGRKIGIAAAIVLICAPQTRDFQQHTANKGKADRGGKL